MKCPDDWKNTLWMEKGCLFELQPDLAIQRFDSWIFVGDVKFKVLPTMAMESKVDRNDIYQMLVRLTETEPKEGRSGYVGVRSNDEVITVNPSE